MDRLLRTLGREQGRQPDELETGPWSGTWRGVGPLGAGGQGATFLVESISAPPRRAVLKKLKRNDEPADRRRMRQEVVNLQVVGAAGGSVPQVVDGNTEESENPGVELYFVMEHVEGETLERRIDQSGPMSIDEAINAALDISRTVKTGHEVRVLHRDLKPANVILRQDDGAAVIVDYGLSFNDEADVDITQVDERIKNSFLALPETNASGGDQRDRRSDVTAICAILFYCLTGIKPGQLLDEHGRAPHKRDGADLLKGFPKDLRAHYLDAVLSRGFRFKTDDRFQSVEQLTKRLMDARSATTPFLADPIEAAAEADQRYFARSRAAQVFEMRQAAQRAAQMLLQGLSRWTQRLPRFSLTPAMQMQQTIKVDGPTDTEVLADSQLIMLIPRSDPGTGRGILFRFVADGLETVVYERHIDMVTSIVPPKAGSFAAFANRQERKLLPSGDWMWAFTFPDAGPHDVKPLVARLDAWIPKAIESLPGA